MVERDESELHVYAIELAGLQLHRWALSADNRDKVLQVAQDWRDRLGSEVSVAYKPPGDSATYIDF